MSQITRNSLWFLFIKLNPQQTQSGTPPAPRQSVLLPGSFHSHDSQQRASISHHMSTKEIKKTKRHSLTIAWRARPSALDGCGPARRARPSATNGPARWAQSPPPRFPKRRDFKTKIESAEPPGGRPPKAHPKWIVRIFWTQFAFPMKFGMIIGDSLANTHTEFHYNRFSRSEDTSNPRGGVKPEIRRRRRPKL